MRVFDLFSWRRRRNRKILETLQPELIKACADMNKAQRNLNRAYVELEEALEHKAAVPEPHKP